MILPDVNVLVYAFDGEAVDHRRYAAWFNGAVASGETLLLPDAVLTGFIRIVNNGRIYPSPAAVADAMHFALILRRHASGLAEGNAVWRHLERLTSQDRGITGRVLPDAYLAAVAISHQARVATRDRGFARFSGVHFFDPASAASSIAWSGASGGLSRGRVDELITLTATGEGQRTSAPSHCGRQAAGLLPRLDQASLRRQGLALRGGSGGSI